jgi:hypothetical protein
VLEYSVENVAISSQNQSISQEPLLPRSPWNSQVVYLRAVFRVKKALDLVEQEAGVAKS